MHHDRMLIFYDTSVKIDRNQWKPAEFPWPTADNEASLALTLNVGGLGQTVSDISIKELETPVHLHVSTIDADWERTSPQLMKSMDSFLFCWWLSPMLLSKNG